MLRSLHLKDVGPGARFDLELGERLNVLTGDNGLGKSFVLDVAWWALTGTWIGRPAMPARGKEGSASIKGSIVDRDEHVATFVSQYQRGRQDWAERPNRNTTRTTGLGYDIPAWIEAEVPILYAQADGGFSLYDSARNFRFQDRLGDRAIGIPAPYHLGQSELWNGLPGAEKPATEGLIRDWARWSLEAAAGKRAPFDLLAKVLEALSPPEEPMRPGESRRLYLDDVRDYPSIDLPYGNVPIAQLSAGMRRIISLAYLVVWSWTEHEKACELLGWRPAQRMVCLVDEIESHLHPKWQRHIAPALLSVLEGLGSGLKPQVIATTHSPMVMASIEPHFQAARDRLFLFELEERAVTLRELPWTKYGDAVGWLTSPVFGLEQARSPEAERAIEAAYDFMAGRQDKLADGLRTSEEIDRELRRLLPDQDRFWPRWVVFRERKTA